MPTWVDKILNSQIVQLGLAALAFLVALWLVIVIVRMLMGGRLRLPGGRTRQARLGIVDAFDLDRQRQLIIVRRDNIEHLIMIGGPNDLVIESEIVRVEARDFRDARREKGFDAFNDPRAPSSLGAIESQGQLPVSTPTRGDDLNVSAPVAASVGAAQGAPAVPQSAEPPRAPTFPLPPRRPVERRSPPPLTTDRSYRSEPSYAPEPAPAAPLPPQPNLANPGPSGPQTYKPAAALAPAPASAPSLTAARADDARPVPVAPRQASPFLKSMPPRPPARPLRRVTPQGEPVAPGASGQPIGGGNLPPQPAPQVMAAPTQPEKDGLASLEEEMAKLLGR